MLSDKTVLGQWATVNKNLIPWFQNLFAKALSLQVMDLSVALCPCRLLVYQISRIYNIKKIFKKKKKQSLTWLDLLVLLLIKLYKKTMFFFFSRNPKKKKKKEIREENRISLSDLS